MQVHKLLSGEHVHARMDSTVETVRNKRSAWPPRRCRAERHFTIADSYNRSGALHAPIDTLVRTCRNPRRSLERIHILVAAGYNDGPTGLPCRDYRFGLCSVHVVERTGLTTSLYVSRNRTRGHVRMLSRKHNRTTLIESLPAEQKPCRLLFRVTARNVRGVRLKDPTVPGSLTVRNHPEVRLAKCRYDHSENGKWFSMHGICDLHYDGRVSQLLR